MADRNHEVAELLRELAELTALDEQSPQSFRVRAYDNARRAVASLSVDVGSLSMAELVKVDGVGKSTAQKIREYVDSGHLAKLDALRAAYPPGVVALSQIPGVGPKAVAKLRAELGVQSIEDLRAAVAAQKVRRLSGFGAKSEEKIAKALERLAVDGAGRRTPIGKAMPLAERLVMQLEAMEEVEAALYCGSLRRFSETIGDLDLLVASSKPAAVMEHFVAMPIVDQVIVRGETKTSVLTHRGLQIDLRVVAREQMGAASLYFTGSKAHNIKLRQRAIERGWLLNEYALEEAEGGRIIATETEEAIYEALGLCWVPPELREDTGEVERAGEGRLPAAVREGDLLGDLHVHTSLSGDGRGSLEEMVAAAKARGYRYLAITEHAEGMAMQGVGRDALMDQRAAIAALQGELGDTLTILHGVELNIGPEGELDYDPEFRGKFDWCLASVHSHFDLGRAQQTQRILEAMRDPSVQMIGHLSARSIGKRPPIDLDLEAVLEGAAATGTALEINSGLPRLDVSVEVMRRAAGRPITFVITSDAHHPSELERVRFGVRHSLRGWMDPDCVANTWQPERFLTWARRRGS